MMVGLSGVASAIGTATCGMASVGAMKKNGGAFGSYMILSALPGSQGLYGFVGYFMVSGLITDNISLLAGAGIFGAGLLMGLVCLLSSYFQSKVCANGIAAIGNGHDVILAAFPELYAILAVAATFLISGAVAPQAGAEAAVAADAAKTEVVAEAPAAQVEAELVYDAE